MAGILFGVTALFFYSVGIFLKPVSQEFGWSRTVTSTQDTVRADSQKTLQEIAQLLKSQATLRLHVVGHTDNQGTEAHNLDLSRRRAANVVRELTAKYGVTANRLDFFRQRLVRARGVERIRGRTDQEQARRTRTVVERDMESAILSATSGLVGSLVGGVSTFAASWLSTRNQYRTQTLVQQVVRRETLYADFISEATKCLTHAWDHQAASPEVIAALYGAAERIRLMSSQSVIDAAEDVIRQVIEAYAAPAKSFEELRQSVEARQFRSPLRAFTDACRAEPMVALHRRRL